MSPQTFPTRALLEARLAEGLEAQDPERVVDAGWRLYAERLGAYFRRAGVHTADVNDLVALVFHQVLRGIRSFDGANFEGWLFRLAWFQVRTWRARRRRNRTVPLSDEAMQREDAQDVVLALHARGQLERLENELSPADAAILFDGDPGGDAALASRLESLGVQMTARAIQVRRYELRRRIAALLVEEQP